MDLSKFLPGRGTKEPTEYFWSISIEPGWVQSGVWYIEDGSAKLAAVGVPTHWEMDEDLISSIDTTLSTAIKDFPEGITEPSKTVFGLNSEWIESGNIEVTHLERLKKICSDLALTPIGFVVTPEALAHYFKVKDNAPLNAVLVGVYEKKLEITIFVLGKMLGTVNVSRSVSISDDIAEGVVRFAVSSSIPSRILIYDGKEGQLEEIRQELMKVNWEDIESVKFLHTPKIEIINPDTKIEAVTLAGASETAGVSNIVGLNSVQEMVADDEFNVQKTVSEPDNESGFMINEDITKTSLSPDIVTAEGVSEEVTDSSFNLPQENVLTSEEELTSHKDLENFSQVENIPLDISEQTHKAPKNPFSAVKITGMFSGFGGIFRRLPRVSGQFMGDKKTLSMGVLVFLLFLFSGFASWWFLPKADVTVYISPQKLTEDQVLTLTSTKETSLENMTLKANVIETTETGEKTKSTTGTKVVGDRATGEVSIYRVGPSLTLQSGTTLNGPNDLDFTLNDTVSLASGSASTASVTTVKVSASKIGAEYNLASGTNFTIGNYSSADMEAKNESSFSGGSSREINAVSKEDQTSLQEDLKNEISDGVLAKLTQEVSEDTVVVPDSLTSTQSDVSFSGKVGDEASSLKLSMTLKSSILTVDKEEVLNISKKILEGKIPQGFVLRDDQLSFSFEKVESSDDAKYTLDVSANLLPQVDTDKVREDIRGKYPNLAKDYFISQVPGFVRAEIRLSPPLPGKLGSLPKLAKNITIQIASDK